MTHAPFHPDLLKAIAALRVAEPHGHPFIGTEPTFNEDVDRALAILSPAPFPSRVVEALREQIDAMHGVDVGLIRKCDVLRIYDAYFSNLAPKANAALVKALEWRPYGRHGQGFEAAALGLEVFYRVSGEPGNWTLTSPGATEYVHTPGYGTRAGAQDAAQVDLERRIRCALVSPSAVTAMAEDVTTDALQRAERFIAGFEDDLMQDGIDDDLRVIRSALAKHGEA